MWNIDKMEYYLRVRFYNIVKMAILSKVIYRCHAIPIKLPLTFFKELEKKHLKFHMQPIKSPHSQGNTQPSQKEKKKKKARGIVLPDLKLYHKATVTKQHGTGTETDTQTNGTEQRAHK